MVKKFFTYLIFHPERIALRLWNGIAVIIPDKLFLAVKFRLAMGYWMDFDNPKTFNEKLQWLKLHDRRPEYTKMVDKADAKNYVAERIGSQYIIPTIGIWERPEDIPWEILPEQFVVKTTHDSGGVIICKDKRCFDISKTIKLLKISLDHNYYSATREWPYKDIKPRVIVEKYMVDESGYELKDYKFFCFNGEPKIMFIASDRETEGQGIKMDFFDMDFHLLPFTKGGHPNAPVTQKKPNGFEKMIELARILSTGIPHIRVDFYDINGHIYFGELTFYSGSGFVPHDPMDWDYKIGEWLNLDAIYEK